MQPRLLQMLYNGKKNKNKNKKPHPYQKPNQTKHKTKSNSSPNVIITSWGVSVADEAPRRCRAEDCAGLRAASAWGGARHKEDWQDKSCTTQPHIAACHGLFSSTDIPHVTCSEAATKSCLIVKTISHTILSVLLEEKHVTVHTVCGCSLNWIVINSHSLATEVNWNIETTTSSEVSCARWVCKEGLLPLMISIRHRENGTWGSVPSHPSVSVLYRDLLVRGRHSHGGSL